jgi:hypothetical protein
MLVYTRGAQIFQRSTIHLQILGARSMSLSKYHTEDPQILGATVKNLVATATWCPRFVHRWSVRWCSFGLNSFWTCFLWDWFSGLIHPPHANANIFVTFPVCTFSGWTPWCVSMDFYYAKQICGGVLLLLPKVAVEFRIRKVAESNIGS